MHTPEYEDELGTLMQRLLGRSDWLEQRGRIKDTELMRAAYAMLSMLRMQAAIAKAQG
jgi:hypothetical protein